MRSGEHEHHRSRCCWKATGPVHLNRIDGEGDPYKNLIYATGSSRMFSLDRQQDLWPPEDVQAGSLVSSASGQSRSEFEAFASAEPHVAATQAVPSRSPSMQNGSAPSLKAPSRTPTVLKSPTGDGVLSRNGPSSNLPAGKAFSIQIGWRLFRLSGASIMSDGLSFASLVPQPNSCSQELIQ